MLLKRKTTNCPNISRNDWKENHLWNLNGLTRQPRSILFKHYSLSFYSTFSAYSTFYLVSLGFQNICPVYFSLFNYVFPSGLKASRTLHDILLHFQDFSNFKDIWKVDDLWRGMVRVTGVHIFKSRL